MVMSAEMGRPTGILLNCRQTEFEFCPITARRPCAVSILEDDMNNDVVAYKPCSKCTEGERNRDETYVHNGGQANGDSLIDGE
jgi:hypothetical protein